MRNRVMLCKIVKKNIKFFEPDQNGFTILPIFGRGQSTRYRIKDNGKEWKENGNFWRYTLVKSWISDERMHAYIPLQNSHVSQLKAGLPLNIDEDTIILDQKALSQLHELVENRAMEKYV